MISNDIAETAAKLLIGHRVDYWDLSIEDIFKWDSSLEKCHMWKALPHPCSLNISQPWDKTEKILNIEKDFIPVSRRLEM